jgi:hypothetical protein
MRKRLITPDRPKDPEAGRGWLALGKAALVEVTSEAEGYPVEGALLSDGKRGWRADAPGPQTIRLLFDQPQTIRVIQLVFKEEDSPRTQEFVLRWLPYGAGSWKDIVRQQWNFSPPDTVHEREEYKVELPSAAALELTINPDISKAGTRASLEKLQLSVQQDTAR